MTSETIVIVVELFVLTLSVAAVVGIFARRLRLPYTVGLVLVGTLLLLTTSYLRGLEAYPFFNALFDLIRELVELEDELTREIILGLFVPPLIFEAAFHLPVDRLRRDFKPILLFAIPGVILTTFLVGWAITLGTDISFPMAIVFGALIAATDPVAVVALFRSLGVPKRLQVLLEGESLMNDGTAIVVFGLALGIASGSEAFSLPNAILDFVVVAGGGLLIGIALGWLVSIIIVNLDDHLIESALTFILALGSYFLAESAHVSGVLAVVAAGVLNGNVGPKGMSPTTRILVSNFWEFTAFIANSLVFLLIGLVVDPALLLAHWSQILIAIVAVLAARALVIFGFSTVIRSVPIKWQIVLHWGGLRGAISLALALGLGASSELRAMAFGVVLFTLVVQGMTMGPLIRRLQLIPHSDTRDKFEIKQSMAIAVRASHEHLKNLRDAGLISDFSWEKIAPVLESQIEELTASIDELLQQDPDVAADDLDNAWREVLRTQRTTLNTLFTDGLIDEDQYAELVYRIDAALNEPDIDWTDISELKTNLGLEMEGDKRSVA